MHTLVRLGMLLVLVLAQAPAPALAQLPQDHDYQVTLRNYLATLEESDFDIVLQPITYEDSYFNSTEELHKTWLLLENVGRTSIMNNTGLRVASSHFVLQNIERDDAVYMRIGRNSGFFDPVSSTWWTTWDYAGNPYYNSLAGKLRMFVAVSIDMMMTDQAMEQYGTGMRSDFLGGYLLKFGYVYFVVKDILPPEIQAAYEVGLRKMFDRIQEMYPAGRGGGNMEMFQLPAMWFVAEAINDDALRTRALSRAKYVVGQVMPGEYFHHHGEDGIDLSYEGINQHFLSWAALLYNDPILIDYLRKSAKLKAYMALPEPDGNFYSPSHFNTGTGPGSAHDQWFTYQRDHAVAMVSDEAKYLIWAGERVPVWSFQGVPDETQMREEIPLIIESRNSDTQTWVWSTPSTAEPALWQPEHWVGGLLSVANHYQVGFYDHIQHLQVQNSPLTKPPFLRGESFIEVFNEDFVIARLGEFGAIIHTGKTVEKWAEGVPGLSGGSLSAFWTQNSGSVILGRSRGTQNEVSDTWLGEEGWNTWAVHAISGVNNQGQPFSTARNRFPEVSREIYGVDSARVDISGVIGQHDNGLSAPDGAITGQVAYTRSFSLYPDGLKVVSTMESDESDQVKELWEMIPVFMKDEQQDVEETRVLFKIGDSWTEATSTLSENVTSVRMNRFEGSVDLTFEEPQSVLFSSKKWGTHGTGSEIKLIQVDLLGSGGEAVSMRNRVSVAYTLSPVASHQTGDPTRDGSISAQDAVLVLRHIIGEQLITGSTYTIADVSGDGNITAFDASLILQRVVGLISCFPADSSCIGY